MRFFCNFQTLWGPINSCCMFFKLHSIFQSWVDVTKSHLFHSPKSRPRPLMSVRVREKNVRFRVGLLLGQRVSLTDFSHETLNFLASVLCCVLPNFFGLQWPGSKTPFEKWWSVRYLMTIQNDFSLENCLPENWSERFFSLLLLISHTWRKLHCLTKAEKMDYSRAQVADDPSNFTTGFFV